MKENLRQQQKQQTRVRLIKAALELSAEKGWNQVSIRELTACCDLTPPAFYRHFSSLDELALELLHYLSTHLQELLHITLKDFGQGQSSITEALNQFFPFVLENQNLFKLFLAQRFGPSELFRHAIKQELNNFSLDLGKILSSGRVHQPKVRAEIITTLLFSIGLDIIYLPQERYSSLQQRLREQIYTILND